MNKKIRVGILGCGAIGSRMAKSITSDFTAQCKLCAIYDINTPKAQELGKALGQPSVVQPSLAALLKKTDLVIEAVTSPDTAKILRTVISAKKHVMVMSVGQLLKVRDIFPFAEKNHTHILVPSGAVGGLDTLKAASLKKVTSLLLTTCKPTSGFIHSAYLKEKGIDVKKILKPTVIFDGDVKDAIRKFPANINVAATLSLACPRVKKFRIRIITSSRFKANSHEITAIGDFGKMTMRTENVICPDNPRTSYLAVLSAIQSLKEFFSIIKIGT